MFLVTYILFFLRETGEASLTVSRNFNDIYRHYLKALSQAVLCLKERQKAEGCSLFSEEYRIKIILNKVCSFKCSCIVLFSQ